MGLALLLALLPCRAAQVGTTFVQLNREAGQRSVEAWVADFGKMREVGISAVIVQWSAEGDIAYVKDRRLPQTEQYDTLPRLFEAAAHHGITLQLGLYSEPSFWGHITADGRVLRDFFLVRVARNEVLQRVLVDRFGEQDGFVGYYIPDEIDDLNWRNPRRRDALTSYLTLMVKRLGVNDPERPVAVSAFFKGRTAPRLFADNLFTLLQGTGIDAVLVQDGRGTRTSTGAHVGDYFEALTKRWGEDVTSLWAVVEAFTQTSAEGEPFSASAAAPARFSEQIKRAYAHFDDRVVMFTFLEYVDPERGDAPRALFQLLKSD